MVLVLQYNSTNTVDAARLLDDSPALVLDCIDDLPTKAELLGYCHEQGLRVLCALGAGGKADGEKMQSAARTASSAVQGAYGFYTTWAPWAVGAAGATMDAIASSTVGQTVIGTLGWAGQQLAPAVTQERLAMVATGLRGLRLCVVLAMAAANLEMIQQLLSSDGAATPAYRVIAATGVTHDGWFTVANLWGIMEYMGAADVALSVLQLVVRALRGSNQPVPFSGRELATFIVEPNAALLDEPLRLGVVGVAAAFPGLG